MMDCDKKFYWTEFEPVIDYVTDYGEPIGHQEEVLIGIICTLNNQPCNEENCKYKK